MKYHVYVSNSDSAFFSKFILDDGKLERQQDIPLDDCPGTVATTADGGLLFVCLRSPKSLESFRVDKRTGQLSSIGKVDVEDGPPYLKTDNTDRFLLSACYRAGMVTVHRIADDGTLSEEPLQFLHTGPRAHSIQTSRSNRFAFVPHTMPTNAIFQFRFDASSGAVAASGVVATATVTLALPKIGLLQGDATAAVGELLLADLGIPAYIYERLGIAGVDGLFDAGPILRLIEED